jgi:hypothetical protein
MPEVSIAELEAAINYWRAISPAQGEALVLSTQAGALADPYAMMIFRHLATVRLDALDPAARRALEQYRKSACRG